MTAKRLFTRDDHLETAPMRRSIRQIGDRGCAWAKQWVLERRHECLTCRDCGKTVSPWEQCCAHCGIWHPAKVSIAVVIAVGITCALVLLPFIVF